MAAQAKEVLKNKMQVQEASMSRSRKKVTIRYAVAGILLLILGSAADCTLISESKIGQPAAPEDQNLLEVLRGLHFDQYLTSPQFEPLHSASSGWEVYTYRTDQLRCILGGEYFLMVRRGTETSKTVIWLEGGGACWPGRDDCTKEAQFGSWIEAYGLASPDDRNPVRTWNFIYVPYCDGSIHLGDSQADYDGDGIIDHWHWGLKSTSAAVRLGGELFPDSQQILIAGCSAGGGGTLGAAPVTRLAFPEARLYVLNISGSGLVNPAMAEARDLMEETWNIGQFIPGDCPRCSEQFIYLYDWLLERDPRLKVGMFSSFYDATVRTGWGMAPEAFRSLIVGTTDAIQTDHPETFERFFVNGEMHCISDYGYTVEGISLWDWIGYLVADDPRWIDLLD